MSSTTLLEMKAIFMIRALCFLYSSAVLCQSDPYVETSLGKIKGSYLSSYSKREFLAFRGIRYAKPPIGQLRFQVQSSTFFTGAGIYLEVPEFLKIKKTSEN